MSAKQLAGSLIHPAITNDSRRGYSEARVIIVALAVWLFTLVVVALTALLS